jgi:hypothetical protein
VTSARDQHGNNWHTDGMVYIGLSLSRREGAKETQWFIDPGNLLKLASTHKQQEEENFQK